MWFSIVTLYIYRNIHYLFPYFTHIFGTKYLGLLYGLVFLSHQFGSFFGAYLGGLFYDLYGSYDYAWYLAIALSIFAGLIHLPIKEQAIERLQKA